MKLGGDLCETDASHSGGKDCSTCTPQNTPQPLVCGTQGEAAVGWLHKKLVVAADLVPTLQDKLGVTLRVLCTVSGAALEGCTYRHPLVDRTSPVVVGGDYITTESGTGLVHTAPGHGQEDYQVHPCVDMAAIAAMVDFPTIILWDAVWLCLLRRGTTYSQQATHAPGWPALWPPVAVSRGRRRRLHCRSGRICRLARAGCWQHGSH